MKKSELSMKLEDNINQQKLNALVAIHLHRKCIRKFRQRNSLTEFLSIAVPVFYITPRFLVKGTSLAFTVEAVGEFLAAGLLVLAVLKIVFKWQDNEVRHLKMLSRNKDVHQEAEALLKKPISNAVVDQFLKRVKYVDEEDEDLLGEMARTEIQEAYRGALKEFSDGEITVCFICGASPWNFKKGSCEACGGTPVN